MSKKLNDVIIILIIPIYFLSVIVANYVQHYEYTFTDKNKSYQYEVYNKRGTSRVYIELNPNLFRDMLDTDYEIKEVYEDENYFIGCDYNDDSERKDKKYYVVIDKNKNTTELFNSENINKKFKNIEDIEFTDVYLFLKKRGRKIGWYR